MGESVDEKIIFDFSEHKDISQWQVIDDIVMGGVSKSQVEQCPQCKKMLCFKGVLSLENNGGFCSTCTQSEQGLDLSAFKGLKYYIKGDGKCYKATIKNDLEFMGFVYQHNFETNKEGMSTILIPFNDFIPVFRGQIQNDGGNIDPSLIKSFGFIIADKQEGPFCLEIETICAYR